MFPFKETFPTPKEHAPGKNAKKYIIVHHTGTGALTTRGVLDGLNKRDDFASCHFLVSFNGDAYKMGIPDDILFHAGVSKWGKDSNLNSMALGIEIIGPDPKLGFSAEERKTVRALIQHLMATFSIPKENVLRHADVTHAKSKDKVLWDGKSPSRKVDVADAFWKIDRTTWLEYQNSLKPLAV